MRRWVKTTPMWMDDDAIQKAALPSFVPRWSPDLVNDIVGVTVAGEPVKALRTSIAHKVVVFE